MLPLLLLLLLQLLLKTVDQARHTCYIFLSMSINMRSPACLGDCEALPVKGSVHRHEHAAQQLWQEPCPLIAHAGAGASHAKHQCLLHDSQLNITCTASCLIICNTLLVSEHAKHQCLLCVAQLNITCTASCLIICNTFLVSEQPSSSACLMMHSPLYLYSIMPVCC